MSEIDRNNVLAELYCTAIEIKLFVNKLKELQGIRLELTKEEIAVLEEEALKKTLNKFPEFKGTEIC